MLRRCAIAAFCAKRSVEATWSAKPRASDTLRSFRRAPAKNDRMPSRTTTITSSTSVKPRTRLHITAGREGVIACPRKQTRRPLLPSAPRDRRTVVAVADFGLAAAGRKRGAGRDGRGRFRVGDLARSHRRGALYLDRYVAHARRYGDPVIGRIDAGRGDDAGRGGGGVAEDD